jgi:hypothetical protein
MRTVLLILLAAGLGLAGTPRAGAQTAVQERLQQNELRQQQIRTSTQRVGDQLQALISEFERNGLAGDEVETLRAIQSVLGHLGEEEMGRIITLLQQARAASDASASRKSVLDAFSAQKTVIIKLKQLVDQYRRQKELYEMSVRLLKLAEKQNASLKETVALEPLLQGKPLERLGETQRIPLQVQVMEQESIKDEISLVTAQLKGLVKALEGAQAERPQNALDLAEKERLNPTLQQAVEELQTARLFSAAGSQQRVRNLLRNMARLVAPPKDQVEALRQSLRELDAALAEQRAILEQTEALKANNRNLENNQEIASRQLDLSDKTATLRDDVQNLAPAAAADLKGSIQQMQKAHANLNGKDGRYKARETLPLEQAALAGLESAKNNLEKQLAKAEENARQPKDTLTQVRELAQQVEALMAEQTRVQEEAKKLEETRHQDRLSGTPAKQQQAVKDSTRDAQAQAGPLAEKAAAELASAAEQMAKSERSLAKNVNAPEAQAAARDALQRARDQLRQKENDLAKSAEQLAGLEGSLKKVQDIIKAEQKSQTSTAQAAAKPSPLAPSEARALAQEQNQVASQTDSLKKEVAAQGAEPAANHLATANQAMNQAQAQLAGQKPQAALARQDQALAQLGQAKSTLEQSAQALREELGQPNQAAASLAEAARQIAQAQEQVNQALGELARQPTEMKNGAAPPAKAARRAASDQSMKQAAASLGKAGEIVNQMTATPQTALPPATQNSLQQAQSNLAQGQAQAGEKNAPAAEQQATQAQSALAQAAAALSLAQAGLNAPSQASTAKPGQPGQANPPGPTPPGQPDSRTGKPAANPPVAGQGNEGNWNSPGGADGPRKTTTGANQFQGLPQRDRSALQQSQGEKYPQEYGPLVEQYLKNLSDDANRKP